MNRLLTPLARSRAFWPYVEMQLRQTNEAEGRQQSQYVLLFPVQFVLTSTSVWHQDDWLAKHAGKPVDQRANMTSIEEFTEQLRQGGRSAVALAEQVEKEKEPTMDVVSGKAWRQ